MTRKERQANAPEVAAMRRYATEATLREAVLAIPWTWRETTAATTVSERNRPLNQGNVSDWTYEEMVLFLLMVEGYLNDRISEVERETRHRTAAMLLCKRRLEYARRDGLRARTAKSAAKDEVGAKDEAA